MSWKNKILAVAILALCFAFISGCTSLVGRLTLVSTKQPQYERVGSATIVKDVKASDSRLWFLFIPLGTSPNYQIALDDCLRKGEGDFMVNARFYESWWSVILFSYGSIVVEGDVGNSRGREQILAP
jgi:hypothetical protein